MLYKKCLFYVQHVYFDGFSGRGENIYFINIENNKPHILLYCNTFESIANNCNTVLQISKQ